jgi:hypothetical protein
MLNNKMSQYFEELYNSVNQYLLNKLCVMLQKHSWVKKNPFNVQDRSIDFNVTKDKKFINGIRFHNATNF